MASTEKQRLAKWIGEQIHTVQADSAPLRLFKLQHVVEGRDKPDNILEVHFRDQTSSEPIAQQLLDHAQGDANASGGTHRYIVKAMYGQQELEHRGGRYAMRIKGESDEDEDVAILGNVSATPGGHLAMALRHNETIMRIAMLQASETLSATLGVLSRVSERLERSEESRGLMLDRLEEQSRLRLDAELQARTQLRREKREDMAIQVATEVLLPKVIQQIGTADTQLELLLKGMSEEQIMAIAATLRPDQVEAFVGIFKTLAAKQEGKEKREEALDGEAKAILSRTIVEPPKVQVKDKPEGGTP